MEYTIDAKNQSPGRVASEAAIILQGKNLPSYQRHLESVNRLIVKNARAMKIFGGRLKSKKYYRHSGFLGGQKVTTLQELIAKKGQSEVLRRAIYGMLPKNKLRGRMMKRLVIQE